MCFTLKEKTTKTEVKEEAQCSSKIVDINRIFTITSQMGKEQEDIAIPIILVRNAIVNAVGRAVRSARCTYISAGVLTVGKQFAAQNARISTQVTSQIAEESSQNSEERAKIKTELDELKDCLRELQLNRPIISTASVKVKLPSFDDTVQFHVFKL